MNKTINLRIIGYVRKNRFYLHCLDTDILVAADSLEEAKSKMKNALLSYLKTFSEEELISDKYLRLAPLRYRLQSAIISRLSKISDLLNSNNFNVSYDPKTEHLGFA